MFLNFAKPPLNDVRVRQALNYAIDRESFAKATMAGLSEVATTVLPKAHWAYDPALANFYKYDPDKAKALLAEAGHKDGLELHLIGYTDQRQQQRQEVLQEQLRKVGIKLRFSTFNIPEGSAAFFSKAEGNGLLSQWTGRPDPSLTFTLLYGKGSYFNSGREEATPEITAVAGRLARQRRSRGPQEGLRRPAAPGAGAGALGAARSSSSSSTPTTPRSRASSPTCWASRASTACGWMADASAVACEAFPPQRSC